MSENNNSNANNKKIKIETNVDLSGLAKGLNEIQKAAEEAEKEQTRIFEKSIEDQITAVKLRQELEDDYTKEMMYDEIETIISGLDKESELYQKYNTEILKGRKKLADDQKKEIGKGLDEILKEYQKAFDELDKKRQNYRNKLMSVGGDLFAVEVTKDEDGNDVTSYTVNSINEQLKAMQEYHANVKKLKNEGASEALLTELTSLGTEDSQQFAKYLSGMSEAEFTEINKLYNEKQKLADELSDDLYSSEAQAISYSIEYELNELKNNAGEYGTEAGESYAEAFTAAFEDRKEEFAELFKNLTVPTDTNAAAKVPYSYTDAFQAEEIVDFFKNTPIIGEVTATVESQIALNTPAAVHTAAEYDASPESQSGCSCKLDVDRILDGLNKPMKIYLDEYMIGEAVIKYEQKRSRMQGS